jgi:hypothetical protein
MPRDRAVTLLALPWSRVSSVVEQRFVIPFSLFHLLPPRTFCPDFVLFSPPSFGFFYVQFRPVPVTVNRAAR